MKRDFTCNGIQHHDFLLKHGEDYYWQETSAQISQHNLRIAFDWPIYLHQRYHLG